MLKFVKQHFLKHDLKIFLKQLLAAILLFPAVCLAATNHSISLAGEWRFQLDRNDTGVAGHWR